METNSFFWDQQEGVGEAMHPSADINPGRKSSAPGRRQGAHVPKAVSLGYISAFLKEKDGGEVRTQRRMAVLHY